MVEEIWKPIDGFPDYEISNLGRVRRGEKICRRYKSKDGRRWSVSLFKVDKYTTRSLAKLLATAFLENPLDAYYVEYIDGNSLNCDLSNLRWQRPAPPRNCKNKDISICWDCEKPIRDCTWMTRMKPYPGTDFKIKVFIDKLKNNKPIPLYVCKSCPMYQGYKENERRK